MKNTKLKKKQLSNRVGFDLKGLLDQVDFDPDNILEIAAHQPKLFMLATDYRMVKMGRKFEVEAQVEMELAQISQDYRESMGDTKVTEKMMSEYLALDAGARALTAQKNEAVLEDEHSKFVVEIFKQRGQACRMVTDLTSGEQISARSAAGIARDLSKKAHARFKA